MKRFSTADICDNNRDKKIQLLLPKFINYGGRRIFSGQAKTIKLNKSNWGLIKLLKESSGKGQVLIVDVNQSFYGIVGDKLSHLAEKAGYEAMIINGYVRDIHETKKFNLALYALGTCPQRCFDDSEYSIDIDLNFANVEFKSGDYIYADEDGIIVCDEELVS